LEAEHEEKMGSEYGGSIFLERFPIRTHPFWNMKHSGSGIYNKLDVLLHGMETIGTAERSIDIEEMKENFRAISEGAYAKLLFDRFGEERVTNELNKFFRLKMIPRFGGGIGVTRLVRAMKKEGLI
jgi:aspartyl/asparaginyl-tRNA synthetase